MIGSKPTARQFSAETAVQCKLLLMLLLALYRFEIEILYTLKFVYLNADKQYNTVCVCVDLGLETSVRAEGDKA